LADRCAAFIGVITGVVKPEEAPSQSEKRLEMSASLEIEMATGARALSTANAEIT